MSGPMGPMREDKAEDDDSTVSGTDWGAYLLPDYFTIGLSDYVEPTDLYNEWKKCVEVPIPEFTANELFEASQLLVPLALFDNTNLDILAAWQSIVENCFQHCSHLTDMKVIGHTY